MGITLLSGCLNQSEEQGSGKEKLPVQIIINFGDKNISKEIMIEKGKNGLQAMELAGIKLEKKAFPTGSFITAIEGKPQTQGYFWALYVNEKFADKSIDSYKITKKTIIEWKYEKISNDFFGNAS